MKKYLIKLISLFCAITLLSSCANSNILRTKKVSSDLTQTSVIKEKSLENTEEYEGFLSSFKESFVTPGLFEGVIPQGICYDKYNKSFIISGYYENEKLPSVIMIVDANTKELTSYHPLKSLDDSDYCGHAGGIAASGSHIYITSSSTCYLISIDSLNATENGAPVKFESNFKLTTKGSFATISSDILWVGDFIESDEKEREKAERITTLESGETLYAYCEGYILKDGLPDSSKINSTSDGYIPDYMLAIPEQVQGMSFTKSGNILLTTSYGRKNNSVIYVFEDVLISDRVGTINIDSMEIDLLACSSLLLKEKIIAPPMIEGATEGNDGIYVVFESGASKYRSHRGKNPTDMVYKSTIE